jgi:hypothetical protein
MIGSLFAGIIGNILAHDLCALTPKICHRLIEHAVRFLPEKDRARYGEEWLSHLDDCAGVLSKFRHASSCLLNAGKLAREKTLDPPFRVLRIEYKHFGSVELNYATHMAISEFLSGGAHALELSFSSRYRTSRAKLLFRAIGYVSLLLICLRAVKKYSKFGDFDGPKAVRFFELCSKSIAAKKTERAYYIDGVPAGTKA